MDRAYEGKAARQPTLEFGFEPVVPSTIRDGAGDAAADGLRGPAVDLGLSHRSRTSRPCAAPLLGELHGTENGFGDPYSPFMAPSHEPRGPDPERRARAALLGRRAGRLVPARDEALDQVDLAFQARHALAQIPKLLLNPLESLVDPLESLVDPLELLVDPLEPLVHMCGQKVNPAVQPRTLAENKRCEGDADGENADEFGRKGIHASDHKPTNPPWQ